MMMCTLPKIDPEKNLQDTTEYARYVYAAVNEKVDDVQSMRGTDV